jgi:predicted ATPase
MAQAVVEPDRDTLHVADVITSLVDKSLISVPQTEVASSYRLLDTTRAYAAVKLAEQGEASAIARRHALYYAERLVAIRTNILQGRDLSAYSRQIGDIRAALEWTFSPSGDSSVGVALGLGAVPLFLGMSMLDECRRWCQQTILALGEEDRGTQRELALQLSLATSSIYIRGNSDEVGKALERGFSLADSLGDTEYQLHFLAGLNLFRTRLADFDGALAAAQRYAAISSAFSRALAEGLARTGRSAEATDIIDALVADAARGSGTFELPEFLRARAGVLLAASPANWSAAEASLMGSLDCAREQSALGWELRSAIALCRLWADHGRVDEARSVLVDVHGRFTEGFGTTDLREAERQLRVLGVRTSHC